MTPWTPWIVRTIVLIQLIGIIPFGFCAIACLILLGAKLRACTTV
jgi:hypothetical protein